MTFEEALKEVPEGILLSNCHQLSDGTWRVNLYRPVTAWEFGDGATPAEAVLRAIEAFRQGVKAKVPTKTAKQIFTLEDLGL